MKNPKTHDALFKWSITSFTEDFFEHYFPEIRVGRYRFLDKEVINRYESLWESLEEYLFRIVEVEIDGSVHKVVIIRRNNDANETVHPSIFRYVSTISLTHRSIVLLIGSFGGFLCRPRTGDAENRRWKTTSSSAAVWMKLLSLSGLIPAVIAVPGPPAHP